MPKKHTEISTRINNKLYKEVGMAVPNRFLAGTTLVLD